MRHLLCFYSLLFFSLCFSQQKIADSLEHQINQYGKKDTTYINLRNLYFDKKSFLTPTDSTWLDFSLKTLEVANTINYTKGRIMAYERIGAVYQYFLSDHYKAIDSYLEGLKIVDGEKSLEKSLEKYENRLLSYIGIIYLEQQDFDKALTNFKKVLDYFPNNISMLSNIGNVYGEKKQSDSAIYYYKRAIKEAKKTNNYLYLANTKSSLSFVLSEVGKIKEALINIEESLALVNTHKLEFIRMAVYTNAAEVYLKNSDHDKAENYSKEVFNLNKSLSNLFLEKSAWGTLVNVYEAKKDYASALDAYKKYTKLNDSISSNSRKLETSRKEIQFEADKEQILAQKEIEKQKLIKNTSILGGSGFVLASIIGFILYRRKQDAITQTKEAEFKTKVADTELKALRAQINPHFIFNSLNSIGDYILKNDTQTANDYLTKFAKLMRKTLENSEKKEVLLADDLSLLKTYLDIESKRFNNSFTYQIEVDKKIDTENTLVPPLILQPFVENSIIHGLALQEGKGHILIEIKKNKDMLICVVDDNGVGRQKSEEAKSIKNKQSLGMKITKSRIDILNQQKNSKGAIKVIDKDKGVRVEVSLPLELAF